MKNKKVKKFEFSEKEMNTGKYLDYCFLPGISSSYPFFKPLF
jgi:hypothetical protein